MSKNLKYEVCKDVLSEEHWQYLHDFISNDGFSWTYTGGTSHGVGGCTLDDDTPQLVRSFFHREQVTTTTTTQTPNYFNEIIYTHEYLQALPQIMMIPQKLLPNNKPLRVKANLLQPYPNAPEHHPWHIDSSNSNVSMVYYINDSDGDTFLGETDTQRVTPKANTAIIFPSNLRHASSNPTKERRMIINYMVEADDTY